MRNPNSEDIINCRLYSVWTEIWERILAMPMPDDSDVSLAASLRRLDTVKESMLTSSCHLRTTVPNALKASGATVPIPA